MEEGAAGPSEPAAPAPATAQPDDQSRVPQDQGSKEEPDVSTQAKEEEEEEQQQQQQQHQEQQEKKLASDEDAHPGAGLDARQDQEKRVEENAEAEAAKPNETKELAGKKDESSSQAAPPKEEVPKASAGGGEGPPKDSAVPPANEQCPIRFSQSLSLVGHTMAVCSVKFSRNGGQLASASGAVVLRVAELRCHALVTAEDSESSIDGGGCGCCCCCCLHQPIELLLSGIRMKGSN